MSDNESLSIKTYDTMIIKVNISIEKSSMILLNVIYVSDFLINIVARSIFTNKKLYFNIQSRFLYRDVMIIRESLSQTWILLLFLKLEFNLSQISNKHLSLSISIEMKETMNDVFNI